LETSKYTTNEIAALRLALVAFTEAMLDSNPERCARGMDTATQIVSEASRSLLDLMHARPESAIGIRFEAVRVINSLCGTCGECPRGRRETP
jgi:hypothetical protein